MPMPKNRRIIEGSLICHQKMSNLRPERPFGNIKELLNCDAVTREKEGNL